MRFSHIVFFAADQDRPAAGVSQADIEMTRAALTRIPGLSRALIYTPEQAKDLFNDDGAPPSFGFQLYFEDLAALEAAAGATGSLQGLAAPGALPSLSGREVTQQAFLNRIFDVPEPRPDLRNACSYVVHYPGPAADENAWMRYYVSHHPPIMKRFPGVRELEILTRVDWMDALPWRRVHHLQRNRILFDSGKALTDALHSPVRHEMRADFGHFPPYEGGNLHYPMATEIIVPVR